MAELSRLRWDRAFCIFADTDVSDRTSVLPPAGVTCYLRSP